MLASRFCSYSCQVTPSIPTAAVFFKWKKASVRQSSSTWCNKAVNLSWLPLRAASRTPCSPRDLRLVRLGVRCRASCLAFLLVGSLSSADSAEGSAPSLFVGFAGTTDPSDCPATCTSALPPKAFADRSVSRDSDFAGLSRFSRLEFPRMLRVFDSAADARTLPWRCWRCCLLHD
jgi:hypothetical protein